MDQSPDEVETKPSNVVVMWNLLAEKMFGSFRRTCLSSTCVTTPLKLNTFRAVRTFRFMSGKA